MLQVQLVSNYSGNNLHQFRGYANFELLPNYHTKEPDVR